MPEPFFHCQPYRADITRAACRTNQKQAVAQAKGELRVAWLGTRQPCLTCPERDQRVCQAPAKKAIEKPVKTPPPAKVVPGPKSLDKQSNFVIPVNFKWQKELYRKLSADAGKNGRTISAEIVARLMKSS